MGRMSAQRFRRRRGSRHARSSISAGACAPSAGSSSSTPSTSSARRRTAASSSSTRSTRRTRRATGSRNTYDERFAKPARARSRSTRSTCAAGSRGVGFKGDGPIPTIPDDVRIEAARRYIEACDHHAARPSCRTSKNRARACARTWGSHESDCLRSVEGRGARSAGRRSQARARDVWASAESGACGSAN